MEPREYTASQAKHRIGAVDELSERRATTAFYTGTVFAGNRHKVCVEVCVEGVEGVEGF